MKKILKENKFLVILLIVLLVAIVAYFLIRFIFTTDKYIESYLRGEEYIMNPKTYGVNEYSPINITDEQMAIIYLNDFKKHIFDDINYAYSLLNESYRNLKFGSIDGFTNYVNSLNFKDMIIDKYAVNNDIITVYTKDEKKYIFKTISVMEYEVYLDDTTVEI